ncbi:hypothetical protein TVAG_415040 [Trichomonas vaginalis G3]|uniref:Uncharacterized protein n=1 Tax=Trichomonas vaginalis (strain ATCC PRA-98 / G3) TaxID=412133 RepID=A2FAI7_TRIV3|nr:spectrin binding [Trichomonas vaginalis G3]EAX98080.1 hypothetical protein TVAG_415040 [Trichomonas vaginalis G3]KAI5515639.1 spectrin binding [Trichomonas vaginalis G3]|eukprot:XP_001311010.1 hypothetical protein [Trichomonas vaginalis G3]
MSDLSKLVELDSIGCISDSLEHDVSSNLQEYSKDPTFQKLSTQCVIRMAANSENISPETALRLTKHVASKNKDDLIQLLQVMKISGDYTDDIKEILKCVTDIPVLKLFIDNYESNSTKITQKPDIMLSISDGDYFTTDPQPTNEIMTEKIDDNPPETINDVIDSIKVMKSSDSDTLSFSDSGSDHGNDSDNVFEITTEPPKLKSADLVDDHSDFNPYMTLRQTIKTSDSVSSTMTSYSQQMNSYSKQTENIATPAPESGDPNLESIHGALLVEPNAKPEVEENLPPQYPTGELPQENNQNTDCYQQVEPVNDVPEAIPEEIKPPPPEAPENIFQAASKGNLDAMINFIEHQISPTVADQNGWTPLHHSAVHSSMNCLKYLLAHPMSNVNALTNLGQQAIHIGALQGHYEVVAYLLNKGSEFDHPDSEGFTPLMYACEGGNAQIVNILIYAGAKVNISNQIGLTPLNIAARAKSSACIEALLNAHAKVEPSKNVLLSPFYISVSKNDVKSARMLADKGAKINSQNKQRVAPIHIAASEGNVEMIKLLLEKGAKIEIENKAKERPLYIAAKNGHVDAVKELIRAGANVNAQQENGNTPLHIAVIGQHAEVVRALLAAHANKRIKNKRSKYPVDIPTIPEITSQLA